MGCTLSYMSAFITQESAALVERSTKVVPVRRESTHKLLCPSPKQSLNETEQKKTFKNAKVSLQKKYDINRSREQNDELNIKRRNSTCALPLKPLEFMPSLAEEQYIQPSMSEITNTSRVGSPLPSILKRQDSGMYKLWNAKSIHILVIDDDDESQDALIKWLTAKKYNIIVFSDGYEFANYASNMSITAETDFGRFEDIDIALVDAMITMPDGRPILDFLRQNELTSSISVVVMSGDLSPQAQDRIIRRGADDFLLKPLTKSIVLSTVRAICEANVNKYTIKNLATESVMLNTHQQLDESCGSVGITSPSTTPYTVSLLKPHILIITEFLDEIRLLFNWLLDLQPIVFYARSCDDAWKAIDAGFIWGSATNINVLQAEETASVNEKRFQLDLCIADCQLLLTSGSVLIDRLSCRQRDAVPLLLISNETIPNLQLLKMTEREIVSLLSRMHLSRDTFLRKMTILLNAVRNRRVAVEMLHTVGRHLSIENEQSCSPHKLNVHMTAGSCANRTISFDDLYNYAQKISSPRLSFKANRALKYRAVSDETMTPNLLSRAISDPLSSKTYQALVEAPRRALCNSE